MAKNNKQNSDQKQQSGKPVCCRTCFHAHLIQYGCNPVLAECYQKPQPGNDRFPYEREVASALRTCALYKYQDPEAKEIEQRTITKEAAA